MLLVGRNSGADLRVPFLVVVCRPRGWKTKIPHGEPDPTGGEQQDENKQLRPGELEPPALGLRCIGLRLNRDHMSFVSHSLGGRTNCDLSGCTRPDRSGVELSRLRKDASLRIQWPAKSSRVQFTITGARAAILGEVAARSRSAEIVADLLGTRAGLRRGARAVAGRAIHRTRRRNVA